MKKYIKKIVLRFIMNFLLITPYIYAGMLLTESKYVWVFVCICVGAVVIVKYEDCVKKDLI